MPDLSTSAELLKVFADPSRVRLLALVEEEPLTVGELVRVTGLTQSRVSAHLARLKEAGLVVDCREGGSTLYGPVAAAGPVAELWRVVRDGVDDPVLASDRVQVEALLRARTGTWADSVAGRMARHYSPGRTWQGACRGVVGLLRLGRVLDVAAGDGALAELLAPRARNVTCVDASERVVASARERLAHLDNLAFVQADMHALPFQSGSFDAVLVMNALCYATEPALAVSEAARVVAPGGLLVLVDLDRHPHGASVAPYDHVHLGFEASTLAGWLAAAGLVVDHCAPAFREGRAPHFSVITAYAHRA